MVYTYNDLNNIKANEFTKAALSIEIDNFSGLYETCNDSKTFYSNN